MKIFFIAVIIAGTFFVVLHQTSAAIVGDGDLISDSDSPDIYIVKTVNGKYFRRLILNPEIFNSYGHLRWEDVISFPAGSISGNSTVYELSELVIEVNPDGSVADPKVYRVSSVLNSDAGERRWLNVSSEEFEALGYDWDSIYYINHTEASPDFYPIKPPLTYQDVLDERAATYPISPSGWSPPGGCEGEATTFTFSPVDENRITSVTPLGRMDGSHVTPTDHGYINTVEGTTESVRTPAAGEIVDIGAFPRPNDFRVTIWHSCTVSTIYIHLTDLAPEIVAHVGDLQPGDNWFADASNPLYLAAGQAIGTMSRSVDFSVHDTNVILSGFVTPSLYYGEAWKIHTVDLYDYFVEPLRTVLRGKSERTVAPIGGKIDHDIDGRLVGNWFLEGTGGYSGESGDYWLSHLAIAYDHVNPDLIRVSVPSSGIDDSAVCNTCFNVYGVKGNTPDPADVTPASGVIKYELEGRGYYVGQSLGVFLVQMLGDRRIKVEVYPGKTSSEVSGFTEAANIYER